MTIEQKQKIVAFRNMGLGYGAIARKVGISENTVKSFCRREAMHEKQPSIITAGASEHCCLYCGKPVAQVPGRKEKKFCSDRCRNKWWNSHLNQVDRRAYQEVVCANCGKTFSVYGHAPRKYCCHECYVEHRFYGGDAHD